MNIAKAAATAIILTIVAAVVSAYLAGCSSFDAEAVVNPLTGAAKISVKATK